MSAILLVFTNHNTLNKENEAIYTEGKLFQIST